MRDPRTGKRMEVGLSNTRSASSLNVFKKAPVKAELAVEMIMPTDGRKMRAFYGREPDGSWRGQVEDIGSVTEANPYTFIRVLDDEVVDLADVEDITGEMALSYDGAVEGDRREWDEEDLYKKLDNRLKELQYNANELKKDFEAGMKLFFGDGWREVAKEMFPKGRPW